MVRFLCALDGGDAADNALKQCMKLAVPKRDKVILVTILGGDESSFQQHHLDSKRAEIEIHGVEAMAFSKRGEVVASIIAAAEEYHADTIVLGAIGVSPTGKELGSVAEHVLRRSKIPCLIVKSASA